MNKLYTLPFIFLNMMCPPSYGASQPSLAEKAEIARAVFEQAQAIYKETSHDHLIICANCAPDSAARKQSEKALQFSRKQRDAARQEFEKAQEIYTQWFQQQEFNKLNDTDYQTLEMNAYSDQHRAATIKELMSQMNRQAAQDLCRQLNQQYNSRS